MTAPGERLERALAAFLAARPSTAADRERLLHEHGELADLLQPMLAGGADGGADARDVDEVGADGSERVLGDFRLVRELGRGGMGVVHEAWQRSLDRRVAVKVLGSALVASPAAVARFRREASAAGRLRHPHVVEVFGFGSDGGEHFFAMQLVDGEPLHQVERRFREPAAAVALAAQLADALAHAHAAGLVHRDVKPGNVLVRADGHALLTDFGVARDTSLPSLTREGGFVGTLDYASPEQVRGEDVDARTDLWSLGVILHELLAGAHPFTGPTQQATMHRILTAEPPSLRGLPGVTDDLAAVVVRLLEKQRTRRYASAAAVLADLRALQRGDAVSVRLPTHTERLRRWAARNPWRAVAATVLLLGAPLLFGLGGYLWANAGRIEAATVAERELAREERLATALWLSQQDQGRDALALLGPASPDADRDEHVVRALVLVSIDETDAARAAARAAGGRMPELIDGFTALDALRLDRPSPVPSDAVECFALGQLTMEKQTRQGTTSRSTSSTVVRLATKALLLSARPRLAYLALLAHGADTGGDRIAIDCAVQSLERHFADSRLALWIRARTLARHRADESLRLLAEFEAREGVTYATAFTRALALEHAGRLDEAIAANRRATELDPESVSAWRNLGATLRKAKHHDEAIAAFEKATELTPRAAIGWNGLGLARRDAGDTGGAADAFQKALDLSFDYAPAAMNLGNLRLRAGDAAGAAEMFERAAASDPTDVRAAANLGDALSRLGRHEDALRQALRASQLAPDDFIPAYNVARLALRLRLPALALPSARRANELAQNDSKGAEVLAEALLAQTPPDAAGAVAAARDADRLSTGRDVQARLLLAQALRADGDRDGARALLEASRAEPRFAESRARERIDAALAALAEPGK
jgi:tetratricopeptide (TPR) repeat protein